VQRAFFEITKQDCGAVWRVCTAHTPHRSQDAAITLTSCTASMYLLLTKYVIFS